MSNRAKISAVVRTTTTTATFLPTSISGCAMWLDGADSTTMFQNTAGTTAITADGQTIGCWKDKSANAYTFTQATTGNQPTYKTSILGGRSITRWNGTSSGLQSSTTLPFYTSASSGGSFFFVFMVTSNNTQRFLMTYQNQNSGTFCVSESEIGCPTGNVDTGNFGIHQGCSKANVALNQVTTNTYMIMNLNLLSSGVAPTNTTIFKNGTSASMTAQNGGFYAGTTYPSANNARYLNIGYRAPNGGSIDCWLAGDIAEIIWFQNPLNTTQQQTIEAYLAQKWGLTSSLPAGHPGLTTSVYQYTAFIPAPTTTTATFLPTSISGCQIWFDGSDTSTISYSSGSNVSTWNSKGSISVNVSTSTSTLPYYNYNSGQPGVYFPSGAIMSSSVSVGFTSSWSMYVVCSGLGTGYTVNFPVGGNKDYSLRYNPSGYQDTNDCFYQSPFYYNGTYYGSTDTASGYNQINGQFSTRMSSTTFSFSSDFYSRYFYGYINEVIIYNSVLSTSQRQTIEAYLAQKWKTTSSLPAGHPGLTTLVYGTVAMTKQKLVSIPKTITTSFSPTSITGCSLWLDAADLTSLTVSSGAVSQWNDKSGNGNNATQSTSGSQPTSGSITQNGLNVLNLTSKTMTYPTISLTTMTVFCVYRQLDFTSYRQPLSVGAFAFFYANGGLVGIGRLGVTDEVSANYSTYGLTSSVYTIYGGTVSISGSTTTNIYFNGTNAGSNTVNSSGGVVRYEIGRSELTNSGYIAEVLLYNSVLSQTNRQTVESYLAQKWGLTSQLPVGHPGLTTTLYGTTIAPTITTITYLPTAITGCKLWLDGADPTTVIFSSGSNIRQWSDKSGNGANITQDTTASQPSYTASSNSVLFSYTTSMLMGNTTYFNNLCGSPFTMFFVHKKLQGHAWLLSPGNYIVTFTGTLRFTTAAVTDLDYTTPTFTSVAAEPLRIFTVQWTGTERNVRMNGQLTAYNMNNNGSTSWTNAPVVDSNWSMGGAGSSSAGQTQNMYEVLFYNSALSTTNRQTVESYLAQKWGLTSNLPTGHPGLTTIVYGTVPVLKQKIKFTPVATTLTTPFIYTGANQTFVVPTMINPATVTVYMWGAAGGGQGNPAGLGGAGAMIQGVLSVTPGQTLTILVGGGGQTSGPGGFGGGGASANQYAGGGGRSSISMYGTEVVIAGAGGGGVQNVGGGIGTFSGNGGNGSGWDGTASMGGRGGNANGTGGAGGTGPAYNGVAAVGKLGGVGANYSSGGGAGYGGGGSSGVSGTEGASGGGGSSLTSNLTLIPGQSVLGYNSTNGYSAPNSASPYYQTGVAAGVSAGNGGNGLVVLVYTIGVTQITLPFSNTTGLLSFFSFDNTINDFQNVIRLTVTGSVSYVTGRRNQAIYLANETNSANGTYATNYLTSSYSLTTPFSISVWFNPTNTNKGCLISTYNTANAINNGVDIYIAGGTVSAAYNNVQNVGASVAISVGTWYHAVVTVNASNLLTFYVNGSQVGSSITQTIYSSGLMIGCVQDGGSSYAYSGYIDDYRIYSRVLTGTEISAIYAGTG